jgi:hypothetical protein
MNLSPKLLDVAHKRLFTSSSILIQRSRKAGKNGFHPSGESINRKTAAMHLDAGRSRSTQVLSEQL